MYPTDLKEWKGLCYGVYGAFTNCKVGDLNQVKSKLNQAGYQTILLHHVISSGIRFVDKEFGPMQNNDPKHTSKLCQG